MFKAISTLQLSAFATSCHFICVSRQLANTSSLYKQLRTIEYMSDTRTCPDAGQAADKPVSRVIKHLVFLLRGPT